MRLRTIVMGILLILSLDAPAADPPAGVLEPPSFAPCRSTELSALPRSWTAAAVLHPFDNSPITLADVWYAADAGAMLWAFTDTATRSRALVLARDGRLNLLYEQDGTLVCSADAPAPLGVPGETLFPADAQCMGDAPLMTRPSGWWRTESVHQGSADWYWRTAAGEPLRMMIYAARDDLSYFGRFSMTALTDFREVPDTAVQAALELCGAAERSAVPDPALLTQPAALVDAATAPATLPAAFATRAEGLVEPGACERYPDLVTFPEQFGMTTFMTGIGLEHRPFPTVVYYDWPASAPADGGAMRTSMRYDDRRPGVSDPTLNNAYLWNGRGLNAFYYEDAARNCCSGLPGLPPVNWMTLDKCSCAGVLRADVFTSDPTLIISCPIDTPQWFWMWYTDKGHPVWFMETNTDSAGTALNLADYYRFEPGVAAPPGTFDPPGFCDNACPTEAVASFPHHHASLPEGHPAVAGAEAGNPWPLQCNNCHTAVNQPWVPPDTGGN